MQSRRSMVSGVLPALIACVCVGDVCAQREPIRGGVNLVAFDFLALGDDGVPAPDLKLEEVTLKVGGRAREIKSFQFVRLAGAAQRTRADIPFRELPPPFGTNYLDDAGRTIVLIIENDSLRAGISRHAIDAASQFVRNLSPRDQVALVTMPKGGLQVDLTRDHGHVRELLSNVAGQGSQQTSESEKSCRTRDTLAALADLLNGLIAVDQPKTIVFVSAGLLLPRRDAPLTAPPGPCELRPVHYDDVGKAAMAARANFYVIKPEDFIIDSAANAFADPSVSRFRSSDQELAGLESLAGVTDGELMRLTPSDHSAFQRVVRETAGYYLLAFEPDPSERNGLSHRVDVTLSRSRVKVRTRPRLTIPQIVRTSAPALTPHAMLRDGRMYRDLPLRAAAFASADEGGSRVKIVGVAEALDRSATLTSASFGLIDGRGRLVAQWTANERELSRSLVISAGSAAPGSYRMRVAAVDSLGRRGASDYEFTAQLVAAGPFRMSALVLGTSRGAFMPKLQFIDEPTAMGYVEIYGTLPPDAPDGSMSVALELATEPEGPPLVTVPAALLPPMSPDRRVASGVVPLAAVVPGDYVVRAVLTVGGKPLGHASRTIRKAVR